MRDRRLYRSNNEKMLFGVCGGLAEYFDVDPTIIRVLFVIGALLNGFGILLYIALALIMPRPPERGSRSGSAGTETGQTSEAAPAPPAAPPSPASPEAQAPPPAEEQPGPMPPERRESDDDQAGGQRPATFALLLVALLVLIVGGFAWPVLFALPAFTLLMPFGLLGFGEMFFAFGVLILIIAGLLMLMRRRA